MRYVIESDTGEDINLPNIGAHAATSMMLAMIEDFYSNSWGDGELIALDRADSTVGDGILLDITAGLRALDNPRPLLATDLYRVRVPSTWRLRIVHEGEA